MMEALQRMITTCKEIFTTTAQGKDSDIQHLENILRKIGVPSVFSNMKLSVIIPSYNEVNTIEKLVDAVLRAPYPDKTSRSSNT